MSKSKYPEKIDSSLELPIARDNITQISSDLFNSLRSAIIQIEKTLGINPNGDQSIDVSRRLSESLDDLGKIKKEAIDALNLVSGPILNKHVADNARIEESKLDLEYSTTTLYSQALSVKADIDSMIGAINDVALKLSLHLNKDSLSQHNAVQIDLTEDTGSPSQIASKSLSLENLQLAIQRIYDGHINLLTNSITSTNNSHSAEQIYFDNSSMVISATNVQKAIEEVSGDFGQSLEGHFKSLNSNGRIKFGEVSNPKESDDYFELISLSAVSFSGDQSQATEISLSSPQTASEAVIRYDILELSNEALLYKKYFKIDSVTLDMSGAVSSINIFGSPGYEDDASFNCRVLQNNNKVFNINGLNTTIKPSYGRSNSPYVTICNPNSATIISSSIFPNQLSSTVKNLTVEVDGSSYIFDVYNSSISIQNLDSIVFKINEYAVDNNIPISAFKIKRPNCYELALSHCVPNTAGDKKERYLKIKNSSSDDATNILGFSNKTGVKYTGTGSNSLFLNGSIIKDTLPATILSGEDVEHNVGTNTLTVKNYNLIDNGVKVGDLLYVDSTTSSETGLHIISSLTYNSIVFDNSSYSFATSAASDNQYFILKSGSSLQDLFLEKITGLNCFMLVDCIYIDNGPFISKRLEYEITNPNIGFNVIVTGVSRDFIIGGETASISISTSKIPTFTDTLGNVLAGEALISDGFYKLFSADNLSFIEIYVSGASTALTSTMSISIHGFTEAPEEVYRLGRMSYSYNLGFVLGSDSGEGVPKVVDNRIGGTIKSHNVSEEFFEKIIEGPRHELVNCGIVSGCNVSNLVLDSVSSIMSFDISSGVYYVNGMRKEYLGSVGNKFPYTSVNLHIYFDNKGCINVKEPSFLSTGDFLQSIHKITSLAYIIISDSEITDMRLFINQSGRKFCQTINVGLNINNCHFTDLQKAVDYVYRAGLLFDEQPEICIVAPSLEINSTITISNPVCIKGLKTNANPVLSHSVPGVSSIAADEGLNPSDTAMFLVKEAAFGTVFDGIHFYNSEEKIKSFIIFEADSQYGSSSMNLIKINYIKNCYFQGATRDSNFDMSANKFTIPVLFQNVTSGNALDNMDSNAKALIFTNNIVRHCGNEYGCIIHLAKSSVASPKNEGIIVSNNIFDRCSPQENTSARNYWMYMNTNSLASSTTEHSGSNWEGVSVHGNTYYAGNPPI